MAKTHPLGIRLGPDTRDALERAARDDDRPVSTMAERILRLWLIERGYLEQGAK